MPDRFRKFTERELEALLGGAWDDWRLVTYERDEPDPVLQNLAAEIEDELTQRKHAAARQLTPA